MFDMNKRLGEEKHGPDVVVALSSSKPKPFDPGKRLGDTEPDGDESPKGEDPDRLMDEACVGICKAMNVSTSAAPKLRNFLEAFCRACDSKPHAEGEHDNEPTTENGTEDSKE